MSDTTPDNGAPIAEPITPDVEERLAAVEAKADRLLDMINQLLAAARGEGGMAR